MKWLKILEKKKVKSKNNKKKERKTKMTWNLEDSMVISFKLKDNYFLLSKNNYNTIKLFK